MTPLVLTLALLAPEPSAEVAFRADWTRARELRAHEVRGGLSVEPDLPAARLPGDLEGAGQEAWWRFVTDPGTPHEQRMNAAARGERWFTYEQVPVLLEARAELGREFQLHHFGLRPELRSSLGHLDWPIEIPAELVGSTRTILGSEWVVPRRSSAHPLVAEDEPDAPWPWSVRHALRRLQQQVRPDYRTAHEDVRRWIAACLELRPSDDVEAQLFAQASACATHHKTLELVAAWRALALDARFPQGAEQIAMRIGESHRLWQDDRGRLALQVTAEDILRHSPHEKARARCAYGLRSLARVFSDDWSPRPPVGALLAACERVAEEDGRRPWHGLYVHAFSVCEAVPEPPFIPDRRMDPRSPEVAILLERFCAWAVDLEQRLPPRDLEAERAIRAELERLAR